MIAASRHRRTSALDLAMNDPFLSQVDNGIPIDSWYDNAADCELLSMLPFLETLLQAEDVRPLIRSKFKSHEKIARAF